MTLKDSLKLNRFEATGIDGQKSVSILCNEGSLWITAGKGFNDIVLKKDQQISLISKERIVIEALADSRASIFTRLSSNECETAQQL